jgi:CRISPR-associated protein Csb2
MVGTGQVSTSLAIRFPLGRYHATPWDRAVNEGEPEWPPSPWRILRALVATRHTRWPDLPEPVLSGLLDSLADPPSYRTPPARHGHTRHYLPDLQHRKGEPGHTDLTLDPFLVIGAQEELLVRWEADLPDEQRQALAKLAELLPYMGRSESVCEARLAESEPAVDETWWQPGADAESRGSIRARLLGVTRPVSLATLEATTEATRKSRRTVPPGTRWLTYARAEPDRKIVASQSHREERPVTALRFAVIGNVPMSMRNGVLLADEAHNVAGRLLTSRKYPDGMAKIADERRVQILGTNGAVTDHLHAHWIPMPDERETAGGVRYLGIWVKTGLTTEEVAALLGLRKVGGPRVNGYEIRGFPEVELLFQTAGKVEQVFPELYGPACRWRSWTPYLPVRHQKRRSLEDYLTEDVAAELRYRDLPSATVTAVNPGPRVTDRWAVEFRRYRMKEDRSKSRAGLELRLEFTDPVRGPLLLGQLSHFGYGVFVPIRD